MLHHLCRSVNVALELGMNLEHFVEVLISLPQGMVDRRIAKEDHLDVHVDDVWLERIKLELRLR